MINQTDFISNQNCLINHGAETIYKGVLLCQKTEYNHKD